MLLNWLQRLVRVRTRRRSCLDGRGTGCACVCDLFLRQLIQQDSTLFVSIGLPLPLSLSLLGHHVLHPLSFQLVLQLFVRLPLLQDDLPVPRPFLLPIHQLCYLLHHQVPFNRHPRNHFDGAVHVAIEWEAEAEEVWRKRMGRYPEDGAVFEVAAEAKENRGHDVLREVGHIQMR